jgi:antitoxin (DNA-binding transcriptional repressor) of toxin-antitoxin stability system
MDTVGIKELRDNLSRILKMVEQGKVITVLRHGKGIVELRPTKGDRAREVSDRLREKKVLSGGTGKIGPLKTVVNRKPDQPVSDLVIEERR